LSRSKNILRIVRNQEPGGKKVYIVDAEKNTLYPLSKRSLAHIRSLTHIRVFVSRMDHYDKAIISPVAVEDDLIGHSAEHIGPTRWRGNHYVSRDDTLPFQRCHSGEHYPGPRKVATLFHHGGKSFQLVATAASVLGRADQLTGEPTYVATIEVLAYFQEIGQPCDTGTGGLYCQSPRLLEVPSITCAIADTSNGKFFELEAKFVMSLDEGSVPVRNRAGLVAIECMINRKFVEVAELLKDRFQLKISVGDFPRKHLELDICYQNIHSPDEIHVCVGPQSDLDQNRAVFTGYNALDTFLLYHTEVLGTTVTINGLSSSGRLEAHLNPYQYSGAVSYRDKWALSDIYSNNTVSPMGYALLCQKTCIWESRIRSRWTVTIHSISDYVLPLGHNSTIVHVAQVLDKEIDKSASFAIPIFLGGNHSHTTGKTNPILPNNILVDNPLYWCDESYASIVNPRRTTHCSLTVLSRSKISAALGLVRLPLIESKVTQNQSTLSVSRYPSDWFTELGYSLENILTHRINRECNTPRVVANLSNRHILVDEIIQGSGQNMFIFRKNIRRHNKTSRRRYNQNSLRRAIQGHQ
jgi:hypothetical protein